MSPEFVRDTVRNQIADKLAAAFFSYYRYKAPPAEVNSWRNSLRAMAQVIEYSSLTDHGVLLEYQLPLTSKRLDCLLCGRDAAQAEQAVIVELKQWDKCMPSEADKLVRSWVGGRERELLHPSVQVGQYLQYLEDAHSAFYDGATPVGLSACSYLHNYYAERDDPIRSAKFGEVLTHYPLFDADDVDPLSGYLKARLAGGRGRPVLERIEVSRFRPSRKLMDYVADTIKSKSPWVLLDEQLVVFERILASVATPNAGRRKQVILVHGGPGTGKSVIAMNLLGELLRKGRNAHYATGSRAFTETLREKLGDRARPLLRYFNSYGRAEFNSIDVLICDEAHRIRETSNDRYTRKDQRSTKSQLREILDAANVSVFFIDDKQVVRPNEIGSSSYIRRTAAELGWELTDYELEVQFRCAGSDGFVKWVENTLGIARTANVLWDGADGFDFRILESPQALEDEIRRKSNNECTARVAAGFCWRWSVPRPDGTLEDDIVIGDYRRPWDAKPGDWKLAHGIPSASLWATDPNGINQVGCVYNIQGFELDYVGVIWGKDLVYRFDAGGWVGDKTQSADNIVKRSKDRFVDLVKNTYRVLLSRGLKGCFVHFLDKETERFVRSRMERRPDEEDAWLRVAEPPAGYGPQTPSPPANE
jgi:DUF2075 family protein